MPDEKVSPPISVTTRWPDELPAPQWANQVVVQLRRDAGEVVLTFGAANPLLAGTWEEQAAQADKINKSGGEVIKSVVRIAMSPEIAKLFYNVFHGQLEGMR